MNRLDPVRLLDPLLSSEAMLRIFSDHGRLQGMLDFEAALARAEAEAGVTPASAVGAITAKCRAELFSIDDLAGAARQAGNPAIPMVKALTALVAAEDAEAARFVHWGATSQDVMDSGLMLQLRQALDLLIEGLGQLADALAALAERHRGTLIAGRTWLQQAMPTTFGLKAAGWLSAIDRQRGRLRDIRAGSLAVQFGGAVGTLAATGEAGLDVGARLADHLGLAWPDLPWHAQRDRVAEVATGLGVLVGAMGKIARDLSLLAQTEVAEAFEPAAAGRGGSSAMPHKRNPVGCSVVLAAALRVPGLVSTMLTAMAQEHERGLGNWPAEWETLPEICRLATGALEQLSAVVGGLAVDAGRMRRNLDLTQGQIYAAAVAGALAPRLGARVAHELIEQAAHRAAAEGRHLRDVVAESGAAAHLSAPELDRLFDPASAVGLAERLVDRAVRQHRGASPPPVANSTED